MVHGSFDTRNETEEAGETGTTALHFAREVIENRGKPSDAALEESRDAGWTDEEIIEIVGHLAMNTFTNYMNDTMQTEVDFPHVEPVHNRSPRAKGEAIPGSFPFSRSRHPNIQRPHRALQGTLSFLVYA